MEGIDHGQSTITKKIGGNVWENVFINIKSEQNMM